MPKIPEILVGSHMESFVSVPSNRNIPTENCRSILSNRFIVLLLFTYVGNSEKE